MAGKNRILMIVGMIILIGAVEAMAQRPNRGQRQRRPEEGALKVGQLAPTFDLKTLDGEETFSLKEFRSEKPVVLFFGSYT